MKTKKDELLDKKIEAFENACDVYGKLTKLIEIDSLYFKLIEKYEADYPLYNDIDLYANIYKLNEEKERVDNKLKSLNIGNFKNNDSSSNSLLKKGNDNDKITTNLLAHFATTRVLANTDIRFPLLDYEEENHLEFDRDFVSYEINKITKNLHNLYLALEKEVFSSNKFYYKMITVINARTKYKDKKHYLLAIANINKVNNHRAVISFIDNDKCQLLSSLLTKYNLGNIYDYDDHLLLNNKPKLKVIYHSSFKDSKTVNVLYSIINSALLNHLDVEAYLTYLFNEFKEKEMDNPSNYLPWSKEMLEKFRARNTKD